MKSIVNKPAVFAGAVLAATFAYAAETWPKVSDPYNTYTDSKDVIWRYQVSSEGNACLGSQASTSANKAKAIDESGTQLSGDVSLPASFTDGETVYPVVRTGNFVLENQMFVNLVIPGEIENVALGTFKGNTTLESVRFKKPASGNAKLTTSGSQVSSNAPFKDCTAVKYVFVGKNIDSTTGNKVYFPDTTRCKFLLPDVSSWHSYTNTNYNGTSPEYFFYGAGTELDVEIDEEASTATFYPATEAALTNALAWADAFTANFKLAPIVNITNRIDMTVSITEEMLQNVTFQASPWFVTFKVATQAQLDNVLAAIPENVPFVIEIDNSLSREELSVPAGRRVSVLVPDGGTFSRRRNGLIILFN